VVRDLGCMEEVPGSILNSLVNQKKLILILFYNIYDSPPPKWTARNPPKYEEKTNTSHDIKE
jgi:hypothetical protein